jgi:hypothetical protein
MQSSSPVVLRFRNTSAIDPNNEPRDLHLGRTSNSQRTESAVLGLQMSFGTQLKFFPDSECAHS